MTRPIRVVFVQTHPTQYFAPWFRHMAQNCLELDVTVLYATQPTPQRQGVGYGRAFVWDTPLLEGYRSEVVRPPRRTDDFHSASFRGLDVPEIVAALRRLRPEVAVVFGWNSLTLIRVLWECKRRGVPVLYRGDTNLRTAPGGWRRRLWAAKTRALLLGCFQGWLSVGSRASEYLRAFGVPLERIFASPHCVDNGRFADGAEPFQTPSKRNEIRVEFGFSDEDKVVLFVGRFDPAKAPADALAAVARLGANVGLLLVGAGSLETELRAQAARLGVRATFAGFLNQTEIVRAYAAAECLVLPSVRNETWGLVVNEALATGLPCVVSDHAGCAPDLVVEGETGARFPASDVVALTAALRRVLESSRSREEWKNRCRSQISRHSFAAASEGVVAACRKVVKPRALRKSPRILACCGGMSVVGGMERQTFEALGALRRRGAAVHCIINNWANWDRPQEPHPIAVLAEKIGAPCSFGRYSSTLSRRTLHPVRILQMAADMLGTSAGLLRDAWRFHPTHLLLPDFPAILRNAPAIALLRAFGVRSVMRLGNVPDRGRFYSFLWRWFFPQFVDRFVAISQFGVQRLRENHIPESRIGLIRNALAQRKATPGLDADVIKLVKSRRTILSVGQIIPFKGVHLIVEAMLQLLAEGRDVQAVIVGRFPDWPAEYVAYFEGLKERALQGGGAGRIHFVGERANVLEIMRNSYLFVAPIIGDESFGSVILEAKSVGLPAVVFANGGLTEQIDQMVTGCLCSEPTLASLLTGIRFFLDDADARERIGAAAAASLLRPDCDHQRSIFEEKWQHEFTGRLA